MFDHVTIGASDREASLRFYRTVLAALGHEPRDWPGPAFGDGHNVEAVFHRAGA